MPSIARYTLTVPTHNNEGTELAYVPEGVAADLMRLFGGYTEHAAMGGWQGERYYRESVRVFTVDTEFSPESWDALRGLARRVKKWAEQESVYITVSPITTELVS